MNKYEAGLEIKTMIVRAGLDTILSQTGGLVAGGAILSLMEHREINDIDVFFPSLEAVQEALVRAKAIPGFKSVYNNATACMFTIGDSVPINFIKKRFFHSFHDLFDDFDFTCTMIGFDCRFCMVEHHIGFDDAFENKKIVFNHQNRYPLTSLKRVLKYQKRGYSIADSEIELMGMAIAAIDIKTGEDFVHHVGGMYSDDPSTDTVFENLGKVMNSYRARNPYG